MRFNPKTVIVIIGVIVLILAEGQSRRLAREEADRAASAREALFKYELLIRQKKETPVGTELIAFDWVFVPNSLQKRHLKITSLKRQLFRVKDIAVEVIPSWTGQAGDWRDLYDWQPVLIVCNAEGKTCRIVKVKRYYAYGQFCWEEILQPGMNMHEQPLFYILDDDLRKTINAR